MWRSDVEMLEVVKARAGAVRRTRRLSGTGAAAVVVLVVGVALALTRQPGDGNIQRLQVAAPGTTSRVPAAVAGPVQPTTTAAPTTIVLPMRTTVAPPPPLPTTAVPPATVAPTTVPVTSSPPTTVAGASRPTPCLASDVVATTSVDKVSYYPGQAVKVTANIRNASARACSEMTYGWALEVFDSAGSRVRGFGVSSHVDCLEPCTDMPTWAPGATRTENLCWDQRDDGTTPAQVPTGAYAVTVTWTSVAGASASTVARIVPDPAAPTTTLPASRC